MFFFSYFKCYMKLLFLHYKRQQNLTRLVICCLFKSNQNAQQIKPTAHFIETVF